MLYQLDQYNYRYLVEVEMMLLMRYKLDPFLMERSLSIRDLQFYIKTLTYKIEEEQKANKSGNKLMKSLVAIRDILNFMTLPEN